MRRDTLMFNYILHLDKVKNKVKKGFIATAAVSLILSLKSQHDN